MQLASATTIVSERERVLLGRIAPESHEPGRPERHRPRGVPAAGPAGGGPRRDLLRRVQLRPERSRRAVAGVGGLAAGHGANCPTRRCGWSACTRHARGARGWRPIRRCTVTGAVPEVQPFLWRSAVAAAPLQLARGIQNKVLEALAAGLPCVVTPQVHGGAAGGGAGRLPRGGAARGVRARAVELLELRAGGAAPESAARADLSGLGWHVAAGAHARRCCRTRWTCRFRPPSSS